MSDHLSPAQFGFVETSPEEWNAARQHYDGKGRSVRLNLARTQLHTGQPGLFPERVQEYVDRPGLKSATTHSGFGSAWDSPVEVYRHEGRVFVGEGHHRIAAALKSGQKTMRARLYE